MMALHAPTSKLRSSKFLIVVLLLLGFGAPVTLKTQSLLTRYKERKVQHFATIMLTLQADECYCSSLPNCCDRYLQNSFMLATEVCLSTFLNAFQVINVPQCVGQDGTSLAVLATREP